MADSTALLKRRGSIPPTQGSNPCLSASAVEKFPFFSTAFSFSGSAGVDVLTPSETAPNKFVRRRVSSGASRGRISSQTMAQHRIVPTSFEQTTLDQPLVDVQPVAIFRADPERARVRRGIEDPAEILVERCLL